MAKKRDHAIGVAMSTFHPDALRRVDGAALGKSGGGISRSDKMARQDAGGAVALGLLDRHRLAGTHAQLAHLAGEDQRADDDRGLVTGAHARARAVLGGENTRREGRDR